MYFSVTASVLIASVIIKLVLAIRVSRLRIIHKIALGDAGNRDLLVAIGAHSNLMEYTPITILLFLVAELHRCNSIILSVLACLFIFCRIGHAWGYISSSGKSSFGRFYGTIGTWVILAVLAVIVLLSLFRGS
jgi:uncharacterized membrane protein YecN with MAPEG domain